MSVGKIHGSARLLTLAVVITVLVSCGGDDEQALVDLTDEELDQLCTELSDAITQDEPARKGACVRGGAILAFQSQRRSEPDFDAVAECENYRQLCLESDPSYVCPRPPRKVSDECRETVADLQRCGDTLHRFWHYHGEMTCEDAIALMQRLIAGEEVHPDAESDACRFTEHCFDRLIPVDMEP